VICGSGGIRAVRENGGTTDNRSLIAEMVSLRADAQSCSVCKLRRLPSDDQMAKTPQAVASC
jgi:hypothetical protein